MSVSTPPDTARDDRASRIKVTWWLVAGLLVLRIALPGGVRYFTYPDYPSWVQPVFEVGTYLLTALLVWHERDHLSDHHIDTAALVILILGKPLELLMRALSIPFVWPESNWPYLLWLPISIGLLVALVLARLRLKSMRAQDRLRLLAGSVIGIALGALTGYRIRIGYLYRRRGWSSAWWHGARAPSRRACWHTASIMRSSGWWPTTGSSRQGARPGPCPRA